MSELFSIQLQNRQQQGRDGIWLDLPTTTEQVQAALRQIGISSDNPQGLFISGYFAEEEKRICHSLQHGAGIQCGRAELSGRTAGNAFCRGTRRVERRLANPAE